MEIFLIMLLSVLVTIFIVLGYSYDRLVDILRELKKLNKANRGKK